MTWRVGNTGIMGSVLVLGLSCGPSAGGSTSGSASGSSSGAPTGTSVDGTGPTVTGPSSTTTQGTGPVTSTTTSPTTGTSTGSADTTTGPGVVCSDDPPAAVPDPPAGCEHVYLLGPDGLPDPTRPAGYWICDPRSGGDTVRVAAVACNCDHQHPPCRDGDEDDCNGMGCGIGETCIDYYGSGLCGCQAQCNQDSDCLEGQACLCAGRTAELEVLGAVNRCVPADCAAAQDCGSEDCKIALTECFTPQSIRCTTPADDCDTHADCMSNYCRWDEVEELWTCDQPAICE